MTPKNKLPISVLLIVSNVQSRRFLHTTLHAQQYKVFHAATAIEGIRQVGMSSPDLIILDLDLPDIDGLEVIRQLRQWKQIPILVLSTREHDRDKVMALDVGADDYLTKPFGAGELLARLRVILRYKERVKSQTETSVFTTGNLCVDRVQRKVFVNGVEIHLTKIEYKLLAALIRQAGQVVSQDELREIVWGTSCNHTDAQVRLYMLYLRRKIEPNPLEPEYLLNERGIGYCLKVDK